jgi:hypothetical protein
MKRVILSAILGVGLVAAMSGPSAAQPQQCYETCSAEYSCSDPCYHGWDETTCGDDGQLCREKIERDDDGDGVSDLIGDNCVGVYNPGQEDCNGNGRGDACDGEPCTCHPEWEYDGEDYIGSGDDPWNDECITTHVYRVYLVATNCGRTEHSSYCDYYEQVRRVRCEPTWPPVCF